MNCNFIGIIGLVVYGILFAAVTAVPVAVAVLATEHWQLGPLCHVPLRPFIVCWFVSLACAVAVASALICKGPRRYHVRLIRARALASLLLALWGAAQAAWSGARCSPSGTAGPLWALALSCSVVEVMLAGLWTCTAQKAAAERRRHGKRPQPPSRLSPIRSQVQIG